MHRKKLCRKTIKMTKFIIYRLLSALYELKNERKAVRSNAQRLGSVMRAPIKISKKKFTFIALLTLLLDSNRNVFSSCVFISNAFNGC